MEKSPQVRYRRYLSCFLLLQKWQKPYRSVAMATRQFLSVGLKKPNLRSISRFLVYFRGGSPAISLLDIEIAFYYRAGVELTPAQPPPGRARSRLVVSYDTIRIKAVLTEV
ncbi:hypothetical protein CEXT_330121 [Caerostris extrusa]|uniref:Uncharacterized protein n=1 Tax=Caerostris extrusa TaxID=172846 RepID=A0AAV4N013_CAEEX|nr:hypothetical protein CEXT_330121 [Caerostris extrusa]